jgi:hypothetical protein
MLSMLARSITPFQRSISFFTIAAQCSRADRRALDPERGTMQTF